MNEPVIYFRSRKGANFYDMASKLSVQGTKVVGIPERLSKGRVIAQAIANNVIEVVSEKEFLEYQASLAANLQQRSIEVVISDVAKQEIKAVAAKYGPQAVINFLAGLPTNDMTELEQAATEYQRQSPVQPVAGLETPKKSKVAEPEQPVQPNPNVPAEVGAEANQVNLEKLNKSQLLAHLSTLPNVTPEQVDAYKTSSREEILSFIKAYQS